MTLQGPMTLTQEEREGYAVFYVQGPINAIHSPQLREAITKAFAQDLKGVICDLGDVNYLDSSGLATLVEGVQTADRAGKKFLLTRMENDRVRHLLEITRLTDLFPHYNSPDEAIEQLKHH